MRKLLFWLLMLALLPMVLVGALIAFLLTGAVIGFLFVQDYLERGADRYWPNKP